MALTLPGGWELQETIKTRPTQTALTSQGGSGQRRSRLGTSKQHRSSPMPTWVTTTLNSEQDNTKLRSQQFSTQIITNNRSVDKKKEEEEKKFKPLDPF